MSILEHKKTIEAGDRVVMYGGKDDMVVITMDPNAIFNSKHGHFYHKDIIGLEYGAKVSSAKGKQGYCYAMLPTAEHWTAVVKHRTQILYPVDNSMITFNLEVKNGSRVVESGTGSGALSTYFLRAIAPKGHLFTYEFHEGRAVAARQDFADNKLNPFVTVTARDVVQEGFLLPEVPAESIDAVFLDLPAPWEVVRHADVVLNANGRICSFSPCMEQVQKTCEALDITTIEVLARPFDSFPQRVKVAVFEDEQSAKRLKTKGADDELLTEVRQPGYKPRSEIRGHTGYLTFARKPVPVEQVEQPPANPPPDKL